MQKRFAHFLCLCLFLFLLASCKNAESEPNDSTDQREIRAHQPESHETEQRTVSGRIKDERILITRSGKQIKVITLSDINGLHNINIIPVDFKNMTDTLSLADTDPVQKVLIEDLDNNGYDELYIITISAGSGSYGTIYGFGSNNDLSMTPIYFPEISQQDLSSKGDYFGYMGHDSIYFDNDKLHRKFPIYKEGDPNCCPTGGEKILKFKLVPGEASWLLTPDN